MFFSLYKIYLYLDQYQCPYLRIQFKKQNVLHMKEEIYCTKDMQKFAKIALWLFYLFLLHGF